jgi:outer membrane protein assembly factor BamB
MRWHAVLVVLMWASVARAGDWPQWLGPNRDGSSPEKVSPWKEAPKEVWRVELDQGFSAPVVADGRVFIHARVKDKEEEEVLALDARTGKQLWRASYARARFTSMLGNGPRATPTVVLGKVYTLGITGVLSCFEAASGKKLWQVDTVKKFQAAQPRFGFCSSPLVEGNRVLVSVGGKGCAVVAFDTDNGEVIWSALDAAHTTSSPVATVVRPKPDEFRRQALFVTGRGLVALNPVDGDVAWEFPLADQAIATSPTPLVVDDLILASSMSYGGVGLRVAAKDGKLTADKVWANADLTGYFSSPVLVGKEHVYMVTAVLLPQPSATLRCLEVKTGKELWAKKDVGDYHAGLIRTGDDKLLLLSDSGHLKLIDSSPKEYRELASSKVCGGTFVTPALAGGMIYVRDDKAVICVKPGE